MKVRGSQFPAPRANSSLAFSKDVSVPLASFCPRCDQETSGEQAFHCPTCDAPLPPHPFLQTLREVSISLNGIGVLLFFFGMPTIFILKRLPPGLAAWKNLCILLLVSILSPVLMNPVLSILVSLCFVVPGYLSQLFQGQFVGFSNYALGLRPALASHPKNLPADYLELSLLSDRNVRISLEHFWLKVVRFRGRRGLFLEYSLRTKDLVGHRLACVIRFQDRNGQPLRGTLPAYRGTQNEAQIRYRTEPIRHQESGFPKVWLFLPLRALPIPKEADTFFLFVETLFYSEHEGASSPKEADTSKAPLPVPIRTPSVEILTPFSFELAPQDPPQEAVLSLEFTPSNDEARTCGACAFPLSHSPTRQCAWCEVALHIDCWEFVGGCTTYACEGAARVEAE